MERMLCRAHKRCSAGSVWVPCRAPVPNKHKEAPPATTRNRGVKPSLVLVHFLVCFARLRASPVQPGKTDVAYGVSAPSEQKGCQAMRAFVNVLPANGLQGVAVRRRELWRTAVGVKDQREASPNMLEARQSLQNMHRLDNHVLHHLAGRLEFMNAPNTFTCQ